ncbi:MAG: endopeptidase La [Chloroflexi bacterium]|nr:endopeptidase La [Chloroflexota bacterium]
MTTTSAVEASQEVLELPLLPRRDSLAFPRVFAQFAILRPAFQRAVEEALSRDHKIVVVGRGNVQERDFQPQDLYRVGTLTTVIRLLRMPDGSATVWLQGEHRVRVLEVTQTEPIYRVKAQVLEEPAVAEGQHQALMRASLALFEKLVRLSARLSGEAYVAAMNAEGPGWLADFVCSSMDMEMEKRQRVLETLDPVQRLETVNVYLAQEVDVLEIQHKISTEIQETMDKSHREHYLREQVRAIQKELGELDPHLQEMETLRKRVEESGMPEMAAKKAKDELERLSQIPPASPESTVLRGYLDWLLTLPWKAATEDTLDIARARQVLDEHHYGLAKVKERILEYLAVRKLSQGKLRSPILCFVGAPGVGKTSLGKSIAAALGRRFVRVSLGGIRDEAEIRGHRRTYIGALPGRILQTMRHAGTINPVFMLDEIDKVGVDFRGDPSSALLEVLDPEQNHSFSDHYLEVPYDLSKVMFITTANVLDPVLPALHDRMEVIELPGYTEEEKLEIARRFLVPKQLQEHGLADGQLSFSPKAIRRIIREHTREAGVRNLERELGAVCRKVAKRVAEGKTEPAWLLPQSVPRYLGPSRFTWGAAQQRDEVGVATGVAYTPAGGDVLTVEVALMPGKGNLTLTGHLGDVMKESAQAALSYARSLELRKYSDRVPLDGDFFGTHDVHIHIPAGATPKDGPSAGVTMTTALISALTGRSVRRDVAMTGEITLRGRVLSVGGIKEKVLAAHRAGVRTFVLPVENRKDIGEIPPKVRRDLQFVYVERLEQVLDVALREAATVPGGAA